MRMSAHWSPFTSNKAFNSNPRMLHAADGMYFTADDERRVLDMTAGLWCSNLGHGRKRVADAMHGATTRLDYAPSFGFGHPASFELAERLTDLAPGRLDHAFFTNSGSESVDTALKIALAYHAVRQQRGKTIFIGRERGYHGVNLGGTSMGGISANTQAFGRWGQTLHLPDVLDIERNAFSRGLPQYGAEKADALEDLITLHGADHIAAVIVEPIQGAGGVILPPVNYLRKIREICTRYDILLIFDEVVCGFGRTGSFTAADEFSVQPDIMTLAKGLTNGVVPMGAVLCRDDIYETVVNQSPTGIELFHGYTYSAHPIACAAADACLDIYEEEQLFSRANTGIGNVFRKALHEFEACEAVVDVRSYGFLGAIEFADTGTDIPAGVAIAAAAWDNGLMVRGLGNAIVVSPPLVLEDNHIAEFVDKIWRSVSAVTSTTTAQPVSNALPGYRFPQASDI